MFSKQSQVISLSFALEDKTLEKNFPAFQTRRSERSDRHDFQSMFLIVHCNNGDFGLDCVLFSEGCLGISKKVSFT